ncbi:diaminobutyrate--2-oxoglutarate transaminase [Tuberibacillus sp. Marseille-P3662]|uniref:diaminobutyrate--2-oxoglutarate transaminase n=1 Tax=Tuberibacillus sp. Marseille-P3662 TaxID=1965358 RepID=UPI000A1C8E00|nr:diaminobutyrate--2-oxoglutarate transaminase [Tuberibacillus sp. Marseille-P3662]
MTTQTIQTNADFLSQQNLRESSARSYPQRLPVAIKEAQGIFVKDIDNKTYYDCLAGAGTLALGHNHPVTIDAMQDTLNSQLPLHTLDLTTPVKERFVDELFHHLPARLQANGRIHFCGPTGADAVEAALKIAKTATGNSSLLAFQGGYHGSTHGTMSISGALAPKEKVNGLIPHVHFLPYPYDYRCPFGIGGETGEDLGLHYIEQLLDDPESGVLPPAAMIVEIVQGEGGSIPASTRWLKEIRRITKERQIPLIIDEIQTGIGRTGKMFAFEHADIEPDILVLSKAIGGSLPLSVMIYDNSLDTWEPGAHIGTFRGNQLAMAAGTETIKFIADNGIPDHVDSIGHQVQKGLQQLQDQDPHIGDVRGRGLMIGIEIVNPKKYPSSSGAYPPLPELASAIQRACFERGLILEVGGRFGATIRLLPPLILTDEQAHDILMIFEDAFNTAVQSFNVKER